jgi:Putative zinc-finger
MTCDNPIDPAILADYWLAALPASEQDAVEEHLFACDECAASLREVIALGESLRALAHSGSLMMVVPESFLQSAARQGLHISRYAPPAGGSVQCTVTAQDDLLIGRLTANLNSARRIDLSLCHPGGDEQFRLRDIPFSPADPAVLWQQSISFAKAAPTSTMVARLLTVDDAGAEALLGEYTFHHTRTLPGPAAW